MVSSVIGFDEKSSLSSEKKILPNQSSSILNESSSSTTGITTTTSTNNDQISKLFPKCRPKNDCNLNNNLTTIICNTTSIITQSPQTSSLSSETSSTVSKSPNIGTNPFINNTNLLQQENINKKNNVNDKILSSGGGQYVYFMNNQIKNQNNKMLPNNIDGIQKYSQKRPGHNNSSKHNYYQYNQNPFIKDTTVERNIWERSRSTITNQIGNTTNVLSSPDLIEMETKMNYQQKLQHQQQQQQSNNYIKIERSPINKHHDDINTITVQKTDKVISDGEVLVFDDIDDEWEIKSNTEIVQNNDYLNQDKYTINTTNNDLSPKINAPDLYNSLEVKKIDFGGSQNMSGIIEYDGSPRKFGQAQQVETSIYSTPNPRGFNAPSTTLFPPRPGFPQRVNPTNSEILTTTTVNQFSADDTSNDVSEICTTSEFTLSESNKKSTFDYLYEFSETRKVLEEFFKNPGKDDDKTLEKLSDFNGSDTDSIDIHYEFRDQPDRESESYIGQRLAKSPQNEFEMKHSPKINGFLNYQNESRDLNDFDLFLDSASRSSGEIGENDDKNNGSRRHSRCFPYSPETTDYDSNCGDLDSEVSLRLIGSEFGLSGEFNSASSYTGACVKFYTSMPVLEDGLSSGHASDTENNNNNNNNININNQSISILMENSVNEEEIENVQIEDSDCYYKIESPIKRSPSLHDNDLIMEERVNEMNDSLHQNNSICKIFKNPDPDLESLYSIHMVHLTPPPPAPAPHRKTENNFETSATDVQAALMDIRSTLQRTKILPTQQEKITIPESIKSPNSMSPIWVPRCREEITSDSLESIVQPLKNLSADEDDADTDLETDRLLGHQRLDDMGFYDEKAWCDKKPRSLLTSSLSKLSPKIQQTKNGGNGISGGNGSISGGGSSLLRQGLNSLLPTTPEIQMSTNNKNTNNLLDMKGNGNGVGVGGGTLSSPEHNDNTTNKIIHSSPTLDDSPSGSTKSNKDSEKKKKTKSKEASL